MPQTIWSGDISFGLVSVGVKMVSATKSKDVSFHQLERNSGSRIRYRKISEASGNEVTQDDIVKGYEIAEGEHVVLEEDELEKFTPASTHKIDILSFADLDEIDPIYFDNPYYVVPDKKSVKSYHLLVSAMEEMGKVAIGRVVLRTKEYLVAIRPLDGVLCVETMRFADEVQVRDNLVPESDEDPTQKEIKMARQIIEALAEPFDPEQYKDTYREEILELIRKKAAGEEIVAAPEKKEEAKVVDLTAALEASLEKAKAKKSGEKPEKKSKAG